jgi:hypothetical protein
MEGDRCDIPEIIAAALRVSSGDGIGATVYAYMAQLCTDDGRARTREGPKVRVLRIGSLISVFEGEKGFPK